VSKPAVDPPVDPAQPLWLCPRCGHRFLSANLWHSCTRFTLDEAFARSTPDARAAFERFVELLEACGPVAVIVQKTRIAVMAQVRFAGASRIRRDAVQLSFALGRRVDLPWITGHETYGPRWIAHRFDAGSPADVEHAELPALLCESYRDLGQRGSRVRTRRPVAAVDAEQ
jgi:hypothetical protein